MVIYKLSDRIPVVIGDIKFWFSPLSYGQKIEISECTKMQAGVEILDNKRLAFLTIKFGVKDVDGLKNSDGSDYKVTLGSDGCLTDDCVSELLGLDSAPNLVSAASHLIREIKEHELPGVKIDLKGVRDSKKKAG